ncbi:MAG: AMP-binding protein [Candidatus Rokubacteria bacterium]|nr:AMP-binding protein [Candidatus Rokubacteria bacterium]
MISAPPRSSVEAEVLDAVGHLVTELASRPGHAVALDDALDRDLGLGSLERVELASRLERTFAVELDDTVVAEAATPRDLVSAVLRARPPRRMAPELAVPLAAAAQAPATARTLVDVLRWHAERDPGGVHVVLPDDAGERHVTYGALLAGSLGVAAALRDHGVQDGESVALMLPTGEAFFEVFFGTLLAGAVPVPLYPPFRPDRIAEYATRQLGILRNADARLLVTFREARPVAAALGAGLRPLREVIDVERLRGAPGRAPAPADRDTGPALIQYTSGSTGAPKGVLLSHANILANIRALGEALGPRPGDVFVSWLPLYHDMGLIGAWLGSLYHGIPVVILSPFAFLARPVRWLRALHRFGGTISAAPNFAFDLCAKKIDDADLAGLDLSAWRLALNGSEAVSAETIERFQHRFGRCGFRAEAMTPVYGLAEASVGLTCTPPGRGPRVDRVDRDRFERMRRAAPATVATTAVLSFVSCGQPLPGHEVRVVEPSGRSVDERVEGLIEFRGPSVTTGYFRNPVATRAAWRDGWMDSGDLGYWAGGELYVTGRRKDIVIKAGRNLYPQAIEEAVADVPGVRRGCVAAFGVADPAIGTERLVVVAESRAATRDAVARVHADVLDRVVATTGLAPDTVVIAGPGAILKTPSGKIRRAATREAWLAGRLGRRPSAPAQWVGLLARGTLRRAGTLARDVAALAAGAWIGVLLALATPPLAAGVFLARDGRTVDRIGRRWCRTVLPLAGCRLRVEGLEHLPRTGRVVLAANHASYLDAAVLLAAIPRRFRFVAKKELTAVPIVGAVIRRVGHLTVDRVDLARSVADATRVRDALTGDDAVLFFPEGTFRDAAGLSPFRLGAFTVAVETGAPVVPIAIRGTRAVLPAGAWLPRPGPITVTIAPPVWPQEATWHEAVRIRDRVRDAIAAASD